MWNHAKIQWNSSNGQPNWFPIDFLWKWSIMDQNYANANGFFSVAKEFWGIQGTLYESWRPAVSENVVHHRTIFRFSVGDLIYLVFQRSQPWSLSIYPEGVDGRMKVQSSMISFVRLGRDQANSEDAKCCLEWWCAWLCYRSIISHSINTCTAGPADCQRKIRN